MVKKITFFTIILLTLLSVLGGCSSSSSDDSYAGILMVNEKDYYWQGDIKDNEVTLDEKIGEVQKRVEKEVKPKENLSSNFLEVGDEIYASNEDSKVIIIKRENGSLAKMTEEDYNKND